MGCGCCGLKIKSILEKNKGKVKLVLRYAVFHKDFEKIWKDSLKHLGGDYEMMVNFPIDPQLN